MNKLQRTRLLAPTLLAALCLLQGCVDRTYDTANIDPGQDFQVVGDIISTPTLVEARISFEGLMGGMEAIEALLADFGLSLDDIGSVPVPITDESFQLEIPLDASLDTSLLENREGDTLTLQLEITSTLAIETAFAISFVNGNGATVPPASGLVIQAATPEAPYTATEPIDLTQLIDQLSDVRSIQLTLNQINTDAVIFHLDDYLRLGIRLEKTGGIVLQ